MADLLNADEIFAIAIQIETNGAEFYRKAAAQHQDADQQQALLDLAGMEHEHARTVKQMREDLQGGANAAEVDPRQEGGLFLSSVVSGYRVEGSPAVADQLSGDESMQRILEIGLDLEKQAVLFYLGLKDVTTVDDAREKIDRIIDEEKKHVVFFTEELEKVKGAAA